MTKCVSVIVPVYNVEKYLAECLDSIINQTYQCLEIIIVNDGSTDRSAGIIEEYAQRDERIHILNKENGGLSDARNKGLESAQGDYITFVDSDDFISKDMIETLVNACELYSCDISFCRYQEFTDGTSPIMNEDNNFDILEIPKHDAYVRLYSGQENITIACAKLYASRLFENIRFPYGKINEDEFTTYKVFGIAHKIVECEHVGYYYRRRKTSISLNKNNLYNMDAIEALIERQYYFWKQQEKDLLCLNSESLVNTILDKAYWSNYFGVFKKSEWMKIMKSADESKLLIDKKTKIKVFLFKYLNGILFKLMQSNRREIIKEWEK